MGQMILVVDDDATIRHSLRVLLESYGYTVREAGGAVEAGGGIRDERPDLIVTDIYMPDGDGFELIREIRNSRHPIPIVVMSGGSNGGFDQLEMAAKLGAVGVIDKPFRPSRMIEVVDRALDGRGAPARR